jgi:1-aminocyclopropane-1-carboxylate deaminase
MVLAIYDLISVIQGANLHIFTGIMIDFPPTPLQEILNHPGTSRMIRLLIKRDDLNDPFIQGNKWRKMQPVLQQLLDDGVPGIISFGGPFSNHLHALAAAGKEFGLKTVGIVRGQHVDLYNPTLRDAASWGMEIYPVSKAAFNLGRDSEEIAAVIALHPDYFCLPEGGSTPMGVRSCSRIAAELLEQASNILDGRELHVAVPAGTGCTAAGVVAGMAGHGQVLIFPAAPYGVDRQTISRYLQLAGYPPRENFKFITDYVFGRFACKSEQLDAFARAFEEKTGILLDPLYTVKMMFGLYDMLGRGDFPSGAVVVAIHTGGLQGRRGFGDAQSPQHNQPQTPANN